MPGDDELSIDFGKVSDWFKRKKKQEAKPEPKEGTSTEPSLVSDKHAVVPHEAKHEHSPASVEKKEDDELSIDFSKIKSWFTKKEHTHQAQEQKKDDDDISIDFSKIKSWFTKKEHSEEKKSDDDISFDFSRVWDWVKKHPLLVILGVLLIMQFVPNRIVLGSKDFYMPWGGMYMRLRSEELPMTEGWANSHVTTLLKNQLVDALNQQYPNLPDERKQKIIDEEWNKIYNQQKSQIDLQVKAVNQQIKEFWKYDVDGKKYTYMPDIDPYTYLRYARNLLEKGKYADEIRDGKLIDNHMVAPLGGEFRRELQPYMLLWQYRILRIFSPKITLMQAASYFPIIFILLAMVPAFFIGRRFAGIPGGIITATTVAILPSIIVRTGWGHADTDAYNIFFPLLITWLYTLMIDAEEIKKIIGFSVMTGFVMGLYAFAWRGGWWYVFDFILAAFAILVTSEIVRNHKHVNKLKEIIKKRAILSITYLASSAVFVSLFTEFQQFTGALLQPLHFVIIKAAAHPTLWPNVYTTVAELNPTDINGVVGSVGGWAMFWIAIAGIAMLLFRRSEGKWSVDLKYAPLFALWIIATMYASLKGVRFTLLMAPAFSVVFGIALGKAYDWAVRVSIKDLHLNKFAAHGVMIALITFTLMGQARAAYSAGGSDIPIMNDAWWSTLTAIKEDSRPDAIINSWWDFGHHFKYVADRAVTFDGASQNTPMAHWIGRVLATSDETEAVGILRMLDCGSNSAFEVINSQLKDPVKSAKLLYRLVVADKKEALAILASEDINEQEKILKLTHCDPPEDYFIASGDMIGKSGVWSHFGFWNFERAKLWMELKNLPQEEAVQIMMNEWNYTREQAEQAYFDVQAITSESDANTWISPWLGILGEAADCQTQGDLIGCTNGLIYNASEHVAVIKTDQGVGRPSVAITITADGGMKKTSLNNSNTGVGFLLYPTGIGTYKCVMGSPELLTSIFARLYFLEGHGLHHFIKFKSEREITGGSIHTYKVDWAGNTTQVYSGFEAIRMAEEEKKNETKKKGAQEGDEVSVYYTGALLDGTVFDSSIKDWKKNNITIESSFDDYELSQPLRFIIGSGQVIEGFDAAVRGMEPGEEQIVQIPPNAAYGFDPKAHKLGNQTLRFKIRLVGLTPKSS
ncbi:MAG: STT3 domain-containing protein [Candidatus Woesearchaeota archaeon]